MPSLILAATVFVPLLLTKPGRVGADTKSYLYLDPSRLLSRAGSMWDPSIGMGTVTHQNVGFLWPIGPYYWAAEAVGLPDWVAQRLWLGMIMVAAGIGVRYMLKAMGQEGPHVTAATFCYALTPYVLTLGSRLSIILLPFAGLPWLIGLTVYALRRRRWREPALFALVVATVGSVNATALILVGVGPLFWVLHEVAVTRDIRFRDAAATVGRIGVLTIGCSLWWLSGLWVQRGFGIEILRYTETAETVAASSVSLELLRGLGYWFFYGEDRFGPWIAPSRSYMSPVLLAFSYVVPLLGLIGAAVSRFRERAFFAALLVAGLFLSVGGYPWDEGPPAVAGLQAFLESDLGLAMRSLPRAAPLIALTLSVFLGTLIASVTATRPRMARPLTAGAVAIAVLALPPLWQGQMVDRNLDRAEDIPAYWPEAAAHLDAQGQATRVLEVPGSDFASYRWGNTVDPVLPGLMDRPYVARELIPYGSPASADLLNALDHRLQERTLDEQALVPTARFMGVGDISVRSDLSYERFNTPRPRILWDQLRNAPGIADETGFGPGAPNRARPELPLIDEAELTSDPSLPEPPEVGVLGVSDPEPILRTAAVDRPILLAGDGDGLVDAASAGLLSGHEVLFYSGSYAGDADGLRAQGGNDAMLVLTDTNRRQAQRWSTIRDTTGILERPGQEPLEVDPTDQRLELFPDADDDASTVRIARGGVTARASAYGNAVSLTPEDDPANAADGDINTSWKTGGFSAANGDLLELTYEDPITTDQVRLLQPTGGVRNRTIAEVELRFDGEDPLVVPLDDSSRPEDPNPSSAPGQVIDIGTRTFSELTVEVTKSDRDGLRRYDGVSAVGLAEVFVTSEDGTRPITDSAARLPVDLLGTLGASSLDNDLAVVLTRQRVDGTVAVRTDPELSMARIFDSPAARSFALSGEVRLSKSAVADNVLDLVLGLPDATGGGVTATSSRRIPGGLANRASAAIDGDPTTWWSPGFLNQQTEFVDYVTASPVTVDEFTVTLLNDGRHSVPRALAVTVDDGTGPGTTQEVELPGIEDQAEANGSVSATVRLPEPVQGTHIRVSIPDRPEAVRDLRTIDWISGEPVVMPVAIAELGIDGLTVADPPSLVSDECRNDLLEIDGAPLEVSLRGTTEDLEAGQPIAVVACEEIQASEGSTTVATTPGAFTGVDLDRLVLRSSAGGEADTATGLLREDLADGAPAARSVTVEAADATRTELSVSGGDAPVWLVLGQSYNEGWTAAADGRDLGVPTLINGYANAWLLPAGEATTVRLEWTPQKLVRWSFVLSILSLLVAAALVAWPRRTAAVAGADEQRIPLDARPAMPRPFEWARLLRYGGPTPSRTAHILVPVGALVLGVAAIGLAPGIVLGLVALLALRVPRIRPVLTVGAPALLAGTIAFQVLVQIVRSYPTGFDWPSYFQAVHQPAWLAVALVLLDSVIDRCWLRRWWPTDDSAR